jgi:mRNA interferase MazF
VELVSGPPARFEVWLVNLDPTVGAEITKTRPAVVVSPDEMNRRLRVAIVAPMTTTVRRWPTRVAVRFEGKAGEVALDQLRAVDRERLVRRLGRLRAAEADSLVAVLLAMFAKG